MRVIEKSSVISIQLGLKPANRSQHTSFAVTVKDLVLRLLEILLQNRRQDPYKNNDEQALE